MNEVDAGRDRATPTSEVELGERRTRDRGRDGENREGENREGLLTIKK
jgi:hypothetical protein